MSDTSGAFQEFSVYFVTLNTMCNLTRCNYDFAEKEFKNGLERGMVEKMYEKNLNLVRVPWKLEIINIKRKETDLARFQCNKEADFSEPNWSCVYIIWYRQEKDVEERIILILCINLYSKFYIYVLSFTAVRFGAMFKIWFRVFEYIQVGSNVYY